MYRKKKVVDSNGFVGYLIKIFKIMVAKHKILTIIWIAVTIFLSIIPSINVLLSKLSIDYINNLQVNSNYLSNAILIFALIAILNAVNVGLTGLLNFIYSKISRSTNYSIESSLYTKLKDEKLEKFEDSEFHKRLTLIMQAVNNSGLDVIKYCFGMIQQLLTMIGVIYILFAVHWSLPIALLGSTIPGMIAIFIAKNMRYRQKISNSENGRIMAYTSSLFFNRIALKEIKIFNSGDFLLKKWSEAYNVFCKRDLSIMAKEELTKTIGVVILQVANAIVSIYLAVKISNNQITIGGFVSLTTAVTTIQGAFISMWGNLGQIFEIKLYTKEMMKFLYEDNSKNEENSSKTVINNIESIKISNLSFKYPGYDKKVVNNINLSIKKGEKIAIVGENGAGKSTLINILLGLFRSYEGQILINGVDLVEVDLSSYAACISVVLQDFMRYIYSVRENVAIGDITQLENSRIIEKALEDVGMSRKIKEFNNGIDTMLSKEYEGGKELSGGQWQKIAIARAMIKKCDMIILDEPTAALDPLTELEVFELFNNLSIDKTTVMISHRLGITRYADKILVLQNGEIVEVGSHNELIKLDGVYKQMYEGQASWYK